MYRISKSGKKPEEFTLNELKEYVRFGNAVASLCVEKERCDTGNADTDGSQGKDGTIK